MHPTFETRPGCTSMDTPLSWYPSPDLRPHWTLNLLTGSPWSLPVNLHAQLLLPNRFGEDEGTQPPSSQHQAHRLCFTALFQLPVQNQVHTSLMPALPPTQLVWEHTILVSQWLWVEDPLRSSSWDRVTPVTPTVSTTGWGAYSPGLTPGSRTNLHRPTSKFHQ